MSSKSKKKKVSEVRVIIEGITAGLLGGVGIKIGLTPSGKGISLFLLRTFCENTGGVMSELNYNCWGFYGTISLIVSVITVFSILGIIKKSKNILSGIINYSIGFIIGFLFVLFFL